MVRLSCKRHNRAAPINAGPRGLPHHLRNAAAVKRLQTSRRSVALFFAQQKQVITPPQRQIEQTSFLIPDVYLRQGCRILLWLFSAATATRLVTLGGICFNILLDKWEGIALSCIRSSLRGRPAAATALGLRRVAGLCVCRLCHGSRPFDKSCL